MANNTEQKLMAEFPPVSTEQWEEVIHNDLKGADYEKKLVWRTAEGFNVRPYYRAEDLKGIGYLGAGIGEFPYVRSTGKCNNWRITQTVCGKDAVQGNQTALKALAGGAEAIDFRVDGKSMSANDLDTLLKGIDLSKVEITFSGAKIPEVAELMLAKAVKEKLDQKTTRINFSIDPIINKLSLKGEFGCSEDGAPCFAKIAGLIKKASEYKKFRFLNVNGQNFHNSGSTIVQELAFTLAVGHEYLARLIENGLSVDQAVKAIRFTMSVSSNYFMEIAKFRAARMLWANIVKAYCPECPCAAKMLIHAVTSDWNMTVYDPYVNMLRGTTEAMSAAIACVNSLEVRPFDAAYERPTDFSSRIARNVQLLLKNESHFDNVVDPSGGSYYIEKLTESIAEHAWGLFKQVEDKGGYIAVFKAGFVQDAIEESAAKKDMNIATRREILLGTNQYPNFTEVADANVTEKTVNRDTCGCGCGDDKDKKEDDCKCNDDCGCDGGCECGCGCGDGCGCEGKAKRLKPYRGAMAFEELRLKVDRSGRSPKAFMLTCGSLAMARARAQFSSNFFGCAGIRVIDNNFFADIDEGVKEALAAKAEIVVVCAADDDYATLVPQIYKKLDGKAILVVAGAPGSQAELEAQGIKNFISVRSNVLETLKSYVKELGI